jgi:ankyrin repeat protein
MPKASSSSLPGQQLHDACTLGDLAAVRKVLDEGVDVNWKDHSGWSALMLATCINHVEVVKLLLDKAAEVNIQNNSGWTVLMMASSNGKIECVRLLLERGADMSIKDRNGKTAKNWANGRVDIVQLLNEVCMLQTQDERFKYRRISDLNRL